MQRTARAQGGGSVSRQRSSVAIQAGGRERVRQRFSRSTGTSANAAGLRQMMRDTQLTESELAAALGGALDFHEWLEGVCAACGIVQAVEMRRVVAAIVADNAAFHRVPPVIYERVCDKFIPKSAGSLFATNMSGEEYAARHEDASDWSRIVDDVESAGDEGTSRSEHQMSYGRELEFDSEMTATAERNEASDVQLEELFGELDMREGLAEEEAALLRRINRSYDSGLSC